jgi:hypothetical protein
VQEAGAQEAEGRSAGVREAGAQERRSIPGLGLGGKRSDAEPLPIFLEVREFSGELWWRGWRKQVRRPASKRLVHDS